MRTSRASAALALGGAFLWMGPARAQFRGGPDWMTVGGDAQRSSWVRTDPKISVESMQKTGFAVAWKLKLANEPGPAATLDRYIGYRGFRSYAFVGSATGELTTFDSDLGRVEWKKSLAAGSRPRGGAGACTGGMTSNVARPTVAEFPSAPTGRGGGGFGRSTAAKSGVGQPEEGAVTIAEIAARNAAMGPDAGRGRGQAGGRGPAGGRAAAMFNPFGPRVSLLDAISPDGTFHQMYVSNGEEPAPAIPFVPANSNAHGLLVAEEVAYAATSDGCGGAPNGIWALDLESKQTAHWTGDVAGADGFALGPDATAYAATTGGDLVGLAAKTLQVKGTYHAGGQPFTTSPVVFDFKGKPIVAAATADGRIHLVDGASLSGAAYTAAAATTLATWQDAAGARWILSQGKDSIAAWKVADQGGMPVLQPGWTSREIASPSAPLIVNGVVFTVSNASPAVLYAFDGMTGKELWNSGRAISAPARRGGLSSTGSQVYLGTSDGTLYAFAFPIEH